MFVSRRQRRQTLKPSENRWVRCQIDSVAEGDEHKRFIVRHFQRRIKCSPNTQGFGETPAPWALMFFAFGEEEKETNMAESVIVVQRNGGGYVQGARVVLGFSNGVTDSVYTDSDGEAVIEHRTTGNATVYVNGQDKGSMNTPGRKLVFI